MKILLVLRKDPRVLTSFVHVGSAVDVTVFTLILVVYTVSSVLISEFLGAMEATKLRIMNLQSWSV